MGGKAIKKNGLCVCRRIPTESYITVMAKVLELFSKILTCEIVTELRFVVYY